MIALKENLWYDIGIVRVGKFAYYLSDKDQGDRFLNSRIHELENEVRDRSIQISNAGSIAEAALQLNGVFAAAESAAGHYLDNVRIGLYCDGQLFGVAVLNQTNNWERVWTNLPTDHEWTIRELNVTDGYTVTYERNGMTFTAINTTTTPTTVLGIERNQFILGASAIGVVIILLVCIIVLVKRRRKEE